MRVLPKNLREVLKEPIGKLVDEDKLIDLLKNEKHVVSIGDQVTYTLLKNDIEPIFCVVDYKTRRGPCSDEVKNIIKSFGNKVFVVKNPAGCISDDLWNIIKFAFENPGSKKIRIEVQGEEDLASLAAIHMAPADVTIIYGLPNKGVLVVKPTDEIKKKVKEVIDKM
jgi:hypothetical protein